MADEDLVRARELLAKYAKEQECGWCARQAEKLATAADELREASPNAEKFREQVQQTKALSQLDNVVGELKSARENQDNFRQRLTDVLERTKGPAPERVEAPTLEERSRELPRPRMPPGFVTPDDLERKRVADYAKYKAEVHKNRGPVRERFAFRAWQFLEKGEKGPLRRRQT